MIHVAANHLRQAINSIATLPVHQESVYFETLAYKTDDGRPTHGPRAGQRCLSVMAVGEGGDFEGAVTVGLSGDDGAALAFNVSMAFFLKVHAAMPTAEGNASLEEVKINGYDYLRVTLPTSSGPITLDGDWQDMDDL